MIRQWIGRALDAQISKRMAERQGRDWIVNEAMGFGVSGVDKLQGSDFRSQAMTPERLARIYRGSWAGRKIVDIPAHDATREWREWKGDDDYVDRINQAERRIGLQRAVRQALLYMRLYGGGALVVGMEGQEWSEPLDPAGRILFVHAVDRHRLTARDIDTDPTSTYFREPVSWQLVNSGTRPPQSEEREDESEEPEAGDIHPSRIIRFVPLAAVSAGDSPWMIQHDALWGDSALQQAEDAIRDLMITLQSGASIIAESQVDVVHSPAFIEQLGNEEYRRKILERWRMAKFSLSSLRVLLLDKDEEWNRSSANITGLPETLKLYLMVTSAAADIPATRFLAQSPSGLSATGESDMRNYYDMIASLQEGLIGDALDRFDDILIQSELGISRDGDAASKSASGERKEESERRSIDYEWRELWQESEREKAERRYMDAQTAALYHSLGIFPDGMIGEAIFNAQASEGDWLGDPELAAKWKFPENIVEQEERNREREERELNEDDPQVQRQFEERNRGGNRNPDPEEDE